MEIIDAADNTKTELSEEELKRFSAISEKTAASVLDICIRLRGTNDFKSTMKDVIASVRELCSSEHCCILVMDENARNCYVLGEAFAPGSSLLPMEQYIDSDFYDLADSWENTMAGGNCIIVRDDKDMEIIQRRNPLWAESLKNAGAKNIILYPLRSRSQLLGYIWSINYDVHNVARIKETMEVTTFILGSELGNFLLLDRLRVLGAKDLMTGVMNRNEMNNRVDSLSHGRENGVPVGVIFADMNGLKAINDAEGHNAGDRLLTKAAKALKNVFNENDIFRAGGDEFSIIITGIDEEELKKKMEELRAECARYDGLSFSMGGCYEKNSSNVRMALRKADEEMYKDKQKFYADVTERPFDDRLFALPGKAAPMDEHEKELFRELNYDFMTGLPSMSYFFKLAESERRNMYENGVASAVVFLNLNGLRFFNTNYGFSEGDALIKEFARMIAEQFGEERCSRFGQDHFCVYTEEEGLENKLKIIFRDMKKANGGKTLHVKAGIYPDSMGLVETSLACDRAKAACNSKRDDISAFYYYDEKMLKLEVNRRYVLDNLERAIEENWIVPFYQPIVRSTNKKVCDEEALARWIDPEKGMLSPADFIPILEDEKLIYKVDLHILELILERIKKQMARGKAHVVPISVNLSRTDFETCDIVEEICNRVDAAGVSRKLITIEITESVIGKNFDYMKEQVLRFQNLGFAVWMDDFGSGYSSLDLLQEIHFQLIKFDMRFMRKFETTPQSRVILTELMRMAANLKTETVCEGVETVEQVEFLREIGCTKMQGYHFCKPISLQQIKERYEKGQQIGFEDPVEEEYQKTVSTVNLYDLGSISNEDSDAAKYHFSTTPMAVVEALEDRVTIVRCNRSYKEFLKYYGAVAGKFINYIHQCENIGQKAFVNEITEHGDTVNAQIRKITDNPLNGSGAYAIAVFDIIPPSDTTISYTTVAKALSADFIDMYQVDLNTGEFIQYSSSVDGDGIAATRKGVDFFETARADAMQYLYKNDRANFVSTFTKETVEKALTENGSFSITYRLQMKPDDQPRYVNMKAVRIDKKRDQIIIAVNDVDAQMRAQEALERLREETTTYNRISVLMGDVIAIYTVDPDTGGYMEYSSSSEYSDLGVSKLGMDFFEDSRKQVQGRIHPDDLEDFMRVFTRENILEKTKEGKIFSISYRLILGDVTAKVNLRAGLVQEKDGPQLIVGVMRG